ncbi:hypothetical protein D0726_003352 [Escherichia coli]|nr:hypothetical protein [Escherichia coli]
MAESNYPLVATNLTTVFDALRQQAEKYPDQPLFIRFIETPSVHQQTINNKQLDTQAYALMLNDIYLGYIQDPMDFSKIPIHVEPGAMAIESERKFLIEIQKYDTTIPKDGLELCQKFFFMAYGRQSPIIQQRIFHPESIVMHIFNNTPLVDIWHRDKGDMISKSMLNYPVVANFDTAKFVQHMAKYKEDDGDNIVYLGNDRWQVSYNDTKVSMADGGIWDRNSRTFGTWSPFPKDGDYLYAINLAGIIVGFLDRDLQGADRVKFVSENWEARIKYICLSAAMSNYQYSYAFDYAQKS